MVFVWRNNIESCWKADRVWSNEAKGRTYQPDCRLFRVDESSTMIKMNEVFNIYHSFFIPRLKLTLLQFPLPVSAFERHLCCKTAIFHSQVILKLNLVTTYNNPAEDVCFVNEHWNWSETTIFDVWVPIRIFLSWTSYSLLARQVSLCSYFVLYSILSIRLTVTVLCSVGILLVYVADFVQVSEKCECSKCVEYAI